MKAKGTLFLEAGYYNPKHDLWEAVIEPIDDGKSEIPWEMNFNLIRNDITIAELRGAAKKGINFQVENIINGVVAHCKLLIVYRDEAATRVLIRRPRQLLKL